MSHRAITAALAAAVVALLSAPLATAATQNQFGGRATVIAGTVAGTPVTVVDTGPVQPGGDALEASLLCYPAAAGCTVGAPDATGGAVQADVFHASAVAAGNRSHATATVADTTLNVAGHTIQATFLAANADVSCSNGAAAVRGSAEIAGLTIDGQTVAVTGQPNQSVPLPGGGTVVVNEQGTSTSANQGSVAVSAMHAIVPDALGVGATDVYVAKAQANAICATPPPPPPPCDPAKDFVTGGGWIAPKKTFAVAGGVKNGAPWGHLEYDDHAGMKVHGTSVLGYTIVSPTRRKIDGMADVNGVPTPYTVYVEDNGEPGRLDRFELWLGGAAPVAAGTLEGGNIQIHKPCFMEPGGGGGGVL